MESLQQENEQSVIDLWQIIRFVLRRFWIIVFSGIFVGLCALIFTKMTTTPMYTSSTKLYILEKDEDSSTSSITGGNLSLSATIAGDYVQLITDREVAENVIAELDLSTSAESLISRISVSMPDSGRIITISVTDTDPYMASKIATAVRNAAAMHIKEVMDSDAINVVEEANIPLGQVMYNYQRNGMVGGIAGMALAIGIIVLQYILNDSIKTAADVERYLGISVLGTIPIMQTETRNSSRQKETKEEDGYARSES